MKILGFKIRLGDPETADIVIFDEVGSQYVRKALNKKYRLAVLKVRPPREISIGLTVITSFLQLLARLRLRRAVDKRDRVLGILRQFWWLYLESCLVAMRPLAVVTFIDNSAAFHWMSRNYRRFPMIAIQNGGRLGYASVDNRGYYLQHLFCFGVHETKLFPDIGYYVKNYHPVGSLVASLHFGHPTSVEHYQYDLLIVSSWRGNIGWPQDAKDTMRSMEIMDRLLARYIGLKKIKAAVILRAERDGEHWNVPAIGTEFDYYKRIYPDGVEIIDVDFSVRNVYSLMQRSHLVVSCLSTVLVEVYGIGKKILYCNFTGTDRYHRDFAPLVVTDDSTWEAFSRKLDELLAQPQAEYQRLHGDYARYLMSFPEGLQTEDVIARKIDEIVATFRMPNNG